MPDIQLYTYSYVLVPIAFILMFIKYKPINWLWLALQAASFFIGVAPFVAAAYLVVFALNRNNFKQAGLVKYHSDGSYTVYPTASAKKGLSPGKVAFRIVGGVIAGLALLFGLFIAFIIISLTVAQPPAGSKTM